MRTRVAVVIELWFINVVPRPRTITDERLLAAAAAVIEQMGPGFTLAQVAKEAGVAVGSVAQRFGSKAGLVRAMTELGRAQAVERMRVAAEAEAGSPWAAVRAAVIAVFADLDTVDGPGVANHLAQLGADLADPALRELLAEHYAACGGQLFELLRSAPRAESAPKPATAARVLLSAVNGAALDWALRPDGKLTDRLGETVDAITKGWRA